MIETIGYQCELGHRSGLSSYGGAVPDSTPCQGRANGDRCPYTAHRVVTMNVRPTSEGPLLIDVSKSLGEELGSLLPWIEPAIRYLTSEHFDVEQRRRVLEYVPAVILGDFQEQNLLATGDAANLEHRSQQLLAAFIAAKAAELRCRNAALQV